MLQASAKESKALSKTSYGTGESVEPRSSLDQSLNTALRQITASIPSVTPTKTYNGWALRLMLSPDKRFVALDMFWPVNSLFADPEVMKGFLEIGDQNLAFWGANLLDDWFSNHSGELFKPPELGMRDTDHLTLGDAFGTYALKQ